jgi:molecular chaperone GrpE
VWSNSRQKSHRSASADDTPREALPGDTLAMLLLLRLFGLVILSLRSRKRVMTTEEKPLEPAAEASSDSQRESGEVKATGSDTEGAAAPPAPESDLERVTAERDKKHEQLLRTTADFDNYRKRMRREVEEAKVKGQQDLVRDILPVFDNLERAVQASGTATDAASVLEGIRMVLKLFEDTAERIGLSRIKTVGERFDPQVHEAIQQKESADAAPGTILTEVVPGYRFGEKLVRAAMVVVARKSADAKKSEPPADAKAASIKPEPGSDAKDGSEEGKGA